MPFASKLSLAIAAAIKGESFNMDHHIEEAQAAYFKRWAEYIERLRKTPMATRRHGKEYARRIFNVGTIGHRG